MRTKTNRKEHKIEKLRKTNIKELNLHSMKKLKIPILKKNTNSVLVPLDFWPRLRHSAFSWSLVSVNKYALRSNCCCCFNVNVDIVPFDVIPSSTGECFIWWFKWMLLPFPIELFFDGIINEFGFGCNFFDELFPWRVRRLLVGISRSKKIVKNKNIFGSIICQWNKPKSTNLFSFNLLRYTKREKERETDWC